jgi:phenylalanyl-tRNA synthetase beta chain
VKIVYDWLKEFADVTAAPAEVCQRLCLSGTASEFLGDSAAGALLEAEVTNNRPDCLAHYGVAREVATLYGVALKSPAPRISESAEKITGAAHVEIECPDLCGRYTARVVRGVRIGPSPEWLQNRLAAMGHNSINNVVDISNYVMFELGQPMHAFDLERLAGQRIVVRRARAGEAMRTLDGLDRKLTGEMCVIADGERGVAIGGVMGAANSQITDETRNLLLESAWFAPIPVRRAAKALGLRTEASIRFERGADPEMAETASRRAAELIQQICGGEILEGVLDLYPGRMPPQDIELPRTELLRVMGADIPDGAIQSILQALGFAPRRTRGTAGSADSAWTCTRPSWRHDVTRPIDLIEEVSRLYGYEKFAPRLPVAKQPAARLPHAEAEGRLRERLVALGYQEIISIPLVDPQADALFRPEGIAPVGIANPLTVDASQMRTTGIPSLLAALEWNVNHGQRNLRLFEIGKSYELRETAAVETRILTLGATGHAREKSLHDAARDFSFADLKGDLDSVGALAGGWQWSEGGPECLSPGRAARLALAANESDVLGAAGMLSHALAERFKLKQHVFLAELRLEAMLGGIETHKSSLRFHSLPRFPAVERDFSLLLPDGVTFGAIAAVIRSCGIPELAGVEPVDLFRGGQIPAGKYSLLVRVTFQSMEATLTDAQLTDFSGRIITALLFETGAALRAS